MLDVIGIGELDLDFVAAVDHLPPSNGFVPLRDVSWQGGGKVPTAIVAASRLGARAGLIAACGDDDYGKVCMRDFEANGVDTSHMVIAENSATNFCICLPELDKGARSFIGKLGELAPLTPEAIDADYIRTAKYLHIWQITPATLKAIEIMREAGGQVMIDADRYYPEIEKNLDKIDVLIGSEYFFEGVLDSMAEADLERGLANVMQRGPKIVVVTLGERGCAVMDHTGYQRFDAFRGEKIIDTTGAGDVFHGAFIVALTRGLSAQDAAVLSSAVSYIKCTELGGRAGIPDWETVTKFLDTGKIDKSISIEKWVDFYRTLKA